MIISNTLREKGMDVVMEFATAINVQNIPALATLLSEDTQIQTNDKLIIQGKLAVINYWQALLQKKPGYSIKINDTTVKDKKLFLIGTEGDMGRATVWEAMADNGKVGFWGEFCGAEELYKL